MANCRMNYIYYNPCKMIHNDLIRHFHNNNHHYIHRNRRIRRNHRSNRIRRIRRIQRDYNYNRMANSRIQIRNRNPWKILSLVNNRMDRNRMDHNNRHTRSCEICEFLANRDNRRNNHPYKNYS